MNADGNEETGTKTQEKKNKRGRPRVSDSDRVDVRKLAMKHTAHAVRVLKGLLKTGSDSIKLQAATALPDRGYGKPINVEERKVEQTVKVQYSDMELARCTAFLLDRANHTDMGTVHIDKAGKATVSNVNRPGFVGDSIS